MYANYYITSYDYVIYSVAIQVNGKLVILQLIKDHQVITYSC